MNKEGIPYKEKGKVKKKYSCNVQFSESEYDNWFKSATNTNFSYIVIVWTNKTLTNTWFVVLDYDNAVRCLNAKTDKGYKNIKITRYGAGHEFFCQGVDFANNEFVKCSFDHNKYFQTNK
jgi:hypothetical protein